MLIKPGHRLDLKSAESILKAAGRDPGRDEINKIALLRGIDLCRRWYDGARFYSTKQGEGNQKKYLEKTYKKAKALDVLLSQNSSWLPRNSPPSSSEPYRASVKGIIANVNRALEPPHEPSRDYYDSFKSRSPFEWLVAYYLPDVFGLLNIGPIDPSEEMLAQNSPYVRFAQAVLAELKIDVKGKPYSPESISKALRNRFGSQTRTRKRKNQMPDQLAFWRVQLLRKEMDLFPKDDDVVDLAESERMDSSARKS